ncbi:hypothetical protein ERW51_16300 [Aliivibrio finisterrensis]|uniref:Uncharacterized protein n=1 Tax=Aliivibrio finisterrensis TaxID=511998 RepID=A0A4Q5KM12_9GAMM|nr:MULTISPECIES: hypothetical protein [Aliivibrio]MDD9176101.1 hypothetical protein [Aliivibrio sp. S3TY1]MDD9193291.1 hypothetical protein [Aliivibrio sp. S2TY2]RYU45856.1 hypothetical protein ERW49_12765 [Aliivibrio finisterrensis]RYU64934.1 hypothetical protein ERW54_17145 [Aliivibrio finisterrensis]RYU68341.1 hypothetical protein ERW51_16300 [Aliivibrio finisterrensis]
MFNLEGHCDWCRKPAMVLQHQYCDGAKYYACSNCNDYAKIDIREYDLAEMESVNQK